MHHQISIYVLNITLKTLLQELQLFVSDTIENKKRWGITSFAAMANKESRYESSGIILRGTLIYVIYARFRGSLPRTFWSLLLQSLFYTIHLY